MSGINKQSDQEMIKHLIQDLKVKARDMDDFAEERKLKQIIKKFERGYKEEFKK